MIKDQIQGLPLLSTLPPLPSTLCRCTIFPLLIPPLLQNLGTFSFTVTLCDTRWRMLILGVLFGYKAAVQIAGIILAFMMRDVQVWKCESRDLAVN